MLFLLGLNLSFILYLIVYQHNSVSLLYLWDLQLENTSNQAKIYNKIS